MSKKRKGLSAEEKCKVILDIYHDKKEPFNLKEMEMLASRGVSVPCDSLLSYTAPVNIPLHLKAHHPPTPQRYPCIFYTAHPFIPLPT
jgi:hypothetical protein